ncbi:MAG: hypothetical protein ACI3T9_04340 [Romboutsia timonensis]
MEFRDWIDNDLSEQIWRDKYQNEGETFEEWVDRVSNGNAEVKQLILDKKFLFGGRILASRGLADKRKVTYSNCYVLAPVEDSIEGIYGTAAKLARTFSYGGGCGIDISQLRPKDSPVNNAARTTSGAVSFMPVFSQVSEVIGQKGRRGALMISMDCNHPDVEDFIDAKKNTDHLNGCNISVRCDDTFMTLANVQGTEQARLFLKLAENNWDYAEPGILYWDTIKGYNLLSEYVQNGEFEFAGVNPCLVGDTLIQTIEGPIAIKDLVGTEPYVYCMDDNGKLVVKKASKVWKTRENAQLVEIDFNRGKLICTPDHLIYTRNRGWVKAIDLQPKDKLNGLGFSKGNEITEMIKLTSDNKYYAHHRFIMEQIGHDIKGKDVHHLDGNHLNNVYSNLTDLEHGEHSKLTNTGHECYTPKDEVTGQFIAKEVHSKPRKTDKVNYEVKGKNFIVKSVKVLDYTEDVYDMTVPGVHNFIANNIVVHNCAEEPLPAGGSCLLGAINLAEFVENEFQAGAMFDMVAFKKAVNTAVKALNDVLDEGLDLHPLEEQRKSVSEWRQIGLGIMGFGDMLIKMRIEYGSDRCLQLIQSIGKQMVLAGLNASCEVAQERGAFDKFDADKILHSTFIENISIPDWLEHNIQEYGLRNSQLFTIAPTGSIGTMLEVSTGVEPLFNYMYTRTTKSLNGGVDTVYKVIAPVVMKALQGENINSDNVDNVDMPNYIVWSSIIDPLDRVAVQGQWQRFIDASISSTVNISNKTTVEEVAEIYYKAWQAGCKGLTIFRDGCARVAILNTVKEEEEEKPIEDIMEEVELKRGEWAPIADDTVYYKRKVYTGCGEVNLFVGYSFEEERLQEIYVKRSGQGGCEHNIDAVVICMSGMLRLGGNLDNIEKAFKGCGACNSFTRAKCQGKKLSPGKSCPTAILNAIKDVIKEIQTGKKSSFMPIDLNMSMNKVKQVAQEAPTMVPCPECGKPMANTGGCNICLNCGYSKCE